MAQESVKRDPSLPYGHQQLAYLYVYRGNHQQALLEAQQAVQLGGPNHMDGYAALAQMLIYDGQPDEAIRIMEDIIRRSDPQSPAFYHYHLGQAYYVKEQYQKAREHLEKAISISPKFRPARNYLVAVYHEIGREAQARAEEARAQARAEEARAEETKAEEAWKEAQDGMKKLLEMGRPQRVENRQRVAPYKDSAITDRLLAAWHKAGG